MKFYPYEKGGTTSFSHAEGCHKTFWVSFYAVAYNFSHIKRVVGGGAKSFDSLKVSDPRSQIKMPPCHMSIL